jgi:NADH-quinone oxidoreductase subunit N
MMLSLAGIPLTAGFIGKFYLLDTGVAAEYWTLVIILVVASTIGLYYYLRVIAAMLSSDEKTARDVQLEKVSALGTAVLTFVTAVVIYLGVQPAGLMDAVHRVIYTFFAI